MFKWQRIGAIFTKLFGGRAPKTSSFTPQLEALESREVLSTSFGLKQVLTSGSGPVSVAVGDFTSDGRKDLIIANEYDGTMTLFKGRGAGLFGRGHDIASGLSFPSAVVAGHFDADSFLDFAVTDTGTNQIKFFHGDGTGSFSSGQGDTIGSGPGGESLPRALAKGDFNEDGHDDLVVANFHGKSVSVFLSSADGTSYTRLDLPTLPSDSPLQSSSLSVSVADFNNDNHLDFVVGFMGGFKVFLGTGGDTFTEQTAQSTSSFNGPIFAVGDFDRDGNQDIALIADFGLVQSSIQIRFGDGSGGFSETHEVLISPRVAVVASVVVCDFNQDGNDDLAITTNRLRRGTGILGRGQLLLIPGKGDGSFQPVQYYTMPLLPGGLAVSDLDRDGRPDIVVTINGNLLEPDHRVLILKSEPPPAVRGWFGR